MNWKHLPAASFLLAVLLLGCRPERMQTKSNTIAFAQAGVSLVVGEEWQALNFNSTRSLSPPTLVSQAGTIRVVLLPPDRSDPAVVADGLRNDFDVSAPAAKHSFRKEQFTSDNGVWGLCVSYVQRANVKGREALVENSHYLVKNGAGRCVAINYVASNDCVDTAAVHRMLRTSLRLQ